VHDREVGVGERRIDAKAVVGKQAVGGGRP
jgi:hypothetical protein